MNYTPSPVPNDAPPGLKAWLADQHRRIAASLRRHQFLQLEVTGLEPPRPSAGMIVYADGTAWDPGAGEGFYGYESGTWVKL